MIINVTQEDIDKGIADDEQCCPVALALCRHTNSKDVYVTSEIQLDGKFYISPITVKQFVKDFDTYEEVYPFEFKLNLQEKE